MPSLQYNLAEHAEQKTIHIFKRITTIGKGEENDIVIPDSSLSDTHAHIHFDGNNFNITCFENGSTLKINKKKVKKRKLQHKDHIRMGEVEMLFLLYDEPVDKAQEANAAQIEAYKKMIDFSRHLMTKKNIEELLSALLDSVIEITKADKGMIILLESGDLQVKAARNLKKENILDAIEKVSDSIIKRVIESKKPIIVSDALNDEDFKTSASVINLQLCSVMAVPLMEKGELFGLLYVGNNNIVNLFEESSLEVLTVFASQASLLIQNALLLDELRLDNRELTKRLESIRFGEIIGSCPAMIEVFRKVEKVASTDISVLVTGETGTGKELIARRIHEISPRSQGPFITINCGAIPQNLLESELFGHVKGAFTGAVATHIGKFQAADRGTLFLDEIGELPPLLQVKLLRAIQEKSVTKIGDTRTESIDIRIITATNRNLEEEIEQGRFREDLFYRINVVSIDLPPLRKRGDDLPLIAKYLLAKYSAEFGGKIKGFTPAAVIAMRKYSWPGNIRQLENRLKKAVVLAEKTHLGPSDLDLNPEDLEIVMSLAEAKEDFQKRYITRVLERNNGNRTKTAKDLGVDPRTIFRHLEKMEDYSNVK
jgi:transcriptional regulator with GAF, ATPase, and Fis domain